MTPSISSEVSMEPPTTVSTEMLSVSTPSSSSTARTASTISSASVSRADSAPLPVIAVAAICSSVSRSSAETSIASSVTISFARSAACRYPCAIVVAWTSESSSSSACSNSSPATTTAVVVPSPTSSSWVSDTSTIMFAAGWSMSISLRIVTPSFVTTTSPESETSILSIPFGPSVVRTDSATAFPAVMFID